MCPSYYKDIKYINSQIQLVYYNINPLNIKTFQMEGRFYIDPQTYNNILIRCKRKNIKYDDNDFEPCEDNIIDPNDEVDDL